MRWKPGPSRWSGSISALGVSLPTRTTQKDIMKYAAQIKGVQTFFREFKDEEGRYIRDRARYEETEAFATQLERDLKHYVKQLDAGRTVPTTTRQRRPIIPEGYLRRLREELTQVELLGLDLKESITNGLPQVYVPAVTNPAEAEGLERQGLDETAYVAKAQRRRLKGEAPTHDLLLHRLGSQSVFVPGDPGSGKSTFCKWAAYVVALGKVPSHRVEPSESMVERLPDGLRGRLPVLIPLRDFWAKMPCSEGHDRWNRTRLEAAIAGWIETEKPSGLELETFTTHLHQGNLLLILDGIDEVPEEKMIEGKPVSPRKAVLTGLADALPEWTRAGNRLLVTSRPYGLRPGERKKLDLAYSPLLALEPDSQRLFVARWFTATDPAHAKPLTAGLLEELGGRREIAELRRNPLLLTALCVKYKEGKRLPDDVYDLYNAVVNQVLFNRYDNDRQRNRVRWRLEAVALGMHYGLDDDAVRPAPLASISNDELDAILGRYAQTSPSTESGAATVLDRREALLEHSGLLLRRGERRAEFYHQDFRDYLAAERWSRERLDPEREGQPRTLQSAMQRFGLDPGWRRMLGFLFAKEVDATGGPDGPLHGLEELDRLCAAESLNQHVQAAFLLADCLELAAGNAGDGGLDRRWVECLRRICRDGLDLLPKAAQRNELCLALGRLGWDDRHGVGLDSRGVPEFAWLPVPGPDAPEFFVSKYLVTARQFEAFEQAEDGYADGRWWQGLDRAGERPRRAHFAESNAPRVDVSWFEAIAFGRWVSAKGGAKSPWAPSRRGSGEPCRLRVALPTEDQWRRAYTGSQTQVFPWSEKTDPDRHANYGLHVGRTTVVGLYPLGVASSGALDMAGNVFEWCLDEFSRGGGAVEASTEVVGRRVVRGGSWALLLEATCVPPTATGSTHETATTTWVFAWCASPILSTESCLLITDLPRAEGPRSCAGARYVATRGSRRIAHG